MRDRRGVFSLLVVLLLVAATAASVAWRLLGYGVAPPPADSAGGRTTPAAERPTGASAEIFGESRPVAGVRVVRDTLWIQVVGSGTADASRRSRVAARAAGVVQRVAVGEGDGVRRGQQLVQLDTTLAMLNLRRAQAALTRAQAQYEQRRLLDAETAELLGPDELARRDRVVRAETGLTEAELALVERELELELTRVRAPFDGRVADLRAAEGAHLAVGAEVLTLVQLDPIHIAVDVLEGELGLVGPGRRAAVHSNAAGGATLAGTVRSVNPRIDPSSRAGRVTIAVPNPDGRILPGSFARVTLDAVPLPNRLLVPSQAVTTRGESHREVVFVLEAAGSDGHGLAGWRYVTLGRRNDTYVEIVPGDGTALVEPGEIVLVDGHHYLAHHTAVHLVGDVRAAGGTPGR